MYSNHDEVDFELWCFRPLPTAGRAGDDAQCEWAQQRADSEVARPARPLVHTQVFSLSVPNQYKPLLFSIKQTYFYTQYIIAFIFLIMFLTIVHKNIQNQLKHYQRNNFE